MSATILPQAYPSFYVFATHHGLTFGRDEHWRLTERVSGEINGVPTSRGVLSATDGILCYIERPDGSVFLGHVQWFVADNNADVDAIVERSSASATRKTKGPTRAEKHAAALEAYV